MKKITLLGVDIAKNVFQLHGVDEKGTPVLRNKLTRSKFVEAIANLGCSGICGEKFSRPWTC